MSVKKVRVTNVRVAGHMTGQMLKAVANNSENSWEGKAMKRLLIICCGLLLSLAATTSAALAQAATGAQAQAGRTTDTGRLVGEVLSIDVSARQLTLRAEDRRQVVVTTDQQTSFFRIPPGETRAEAATRIALTDIGAGDRVFARGQAAADGQTFAARQLVVTSRATGGAAATSGQARDDWTARGVAGRVSSLNVAKKEITLLTRGRDGQQEAIVDASGSVRFMRYAPDSFRLEDASASSFAEIRIGDQLRARGTPSADGRRLTAEEVIAGSFLRVGGTVTGVNASAGELTLKSAQSGEQLTVRLGQRSVLRRATDEVTAAFRQRVERREERRDRREAEGETEATRRQRREERAARQQAEGAGASPAGRAAGGERPRGGGGSGRGLMGMMENLPVISLADLKKGDSVLVFASTGVDASRLTVITLLTGEADFINRLQMFQGRGGRDDQTGLPGSVLGGGTPNPSDREGRERERPREPANDQPK